MQKAGQVANSLRSSVPGQPRNDSNSGWPERAVTRLWAYLADLFGDGWERRYGDATGMNGQLTSTAVRWRGEFAKRGLTVQDVFNAVQAYLDRDTGNRGFPPSLDDILGLCRKPNRPMELRDQPKALPVQKAPPEVAARWLAEIRETLNGTNSEPKPDYDELRNRRVSF